MSRRQLRRLQGLISQGEDEEAADISEEEAQSTTSAWAALGSSTKKKNKNKKKKNGKTDQPGEEEVVTGEAEAEVTGSEHIDTTSRDKTTASKAKGKKQAKEHKDSDEELDQILQKFSAKVSAKPTSAPGVCLPHQELLELLECDPEYLNPENELRRLFGRSMPGRQKGLKASTGRQAQKPASHRRTVLVKAKEDWPPHFSHGLTLSLVSTDAQGVATYSLQHSLEYAQVEAMFAAIAARHDPQGLVAFSHRFPYHIQTLYELSIVAQLTGSLERANDLLQRALYGLEVAGLSAGFPWLAPAAKPRRLPWAEPGNQVAFHVLQRYCHLLCRAGHFRTATEFTKLLFSLDLDQDPCACLLSLDFYAVRASQWKYLHDFRRALSSFSPALAELPGLMYFDALGQYLQEAVSAGGGAQSYRGDPAHAASCALLDAAIALHPQGLVLLMEQLDPATPHPWLEHPLFANPCPSALFLKLYSILPARGVDLWKRADVQDWLQSGVGRTLRSLTEGRCSLAELTERQVRLYEMPAFQVYVDVSVADLLGRIETIPAEEDDQGGPDPAPDDVAADFAAQFDGGDWLQDEEALLADIGEEEAVLRAVQESEGNVWVPAEDSDELEFDD